MPGSSAPALDLLFHPLTPERWAGFEALFGENGAYGGCWCMFWRLPGSQFSAGKRNKGAGNRQAMRALVERGVLPGLLAYQAGEAIGWCSVGPREDFGRIERSPTLKRVDARRTWSVNCFFVARPYRSQGVMVALLRAAVKYAAAHGAELVEGYPVEPGEGKVPAMEAYTGVPSAFRQAGFRKARKHVGGRAVSRYLYVCK